MWDLEELFDLTNDPGEPNNLIGAPALLGVKVDLRQRLFAVLASQQGTHAVPYGRKFNQGASFRDPNKSKAAEYPPQWLRGAEAEDRLERIVPDGPNKEAVLKRLREVLGDG